MTKVEGPTSRKREVLYEVIGSQITYVYLAWYQVMQIKLERRALLRVASGYRIVSTIAVITGIPPLVLQMEEGVEMFRIKELHQNLE